MISVKNLRKSFGGVQILRDVSAEIDQGDVISIIGPSGTGKSTFLRCLNLLEQPDGGEIWVDGQNMLAPGSNITALRRRMGMVFQSFNLFSHLMIIENMMLGPAQLLGMGRQAAFNQGMALLESVGIADKAYAYPDELSGGQKQRAAIARTVAMQPEIILFDEPTSALDPTMVSEVLAVIRKLADQGLTMMIVTHEMDFARDVSSRVFYMDEGVIYEDGPPAQVFGASLREKTRAFIQKIKSLRFPIDSPTFDFYRMNSEVEAFAAKHMLGAQPLRALLALSEELIMHLLLPRMALPIDMELAVEYAEKSREVTMIVRYAGPDLHPMADAEDLPVVLIRGFSKSVETGAAEGCNFVRIRL